MPLVRVEPLGRQVVCAEDQPILDACLRAGVWLPHACTSGTCGTCKASLLEGDVDLGDPSLDALAEEERAGGGLLLCCARPRSDVTIAGSVVSEPGLVFHPVRDYEATVAAVEDCARDTRRLILHLDEPLLFTAGQCVSLHVPGTDTSRLYSLANPPAEPYRVELHVRRTEGGLVTDGWVFATLREGQRVRLSGPFGRFLLRANRPEPVLMVAGGTGLAPLKSMIGHLLGQALEQRVYLYQGARTRADLYDVDHFQRLASDHREQLTYRPCLSDERWEGACGTVTDVLDAEFDRCRGFVAYVCGPPAMLDAAVKTLLRKRVLSRDIYREDFFDQSRRRPAV